MNPVPDIYIPEYTSTLYESMVRNAQVKYNLTSLIAGGLARYILQHIETGGFLRAVLENDLKEACILADATNRYRIFDIIKFLHSEAPMECWGSSEAVTYWLRRTDDPE